ncbi:acyl-CoA dehydrogenase [Mycolicibacterium moriokaense]|nr:acyl-CoA dehydrogenase [Mycolicibacterium moriokaense]
MAFNPLAGGVLSPPDSGGDEWAELRRLIDDMVARAAKSGAVNDGVEQRFDAALWGHLNDSGLTRLTSTRQSGAGPSELAVMLRGLARHCAAVPVAETDLLGAWLADRAAVDCRQDAPLSVAIGDAMPDPRTGDRVTVTATGVPWARDATVLVAVPIADRLLVAVAEEPLTTDGHNLAGEPRCDVTVDVPSSAFTEVGREVADELTRRGAWARCVQTIGALDASAELAVAHARTRTQFGRALSGFQAVQQSLAIMAGAIERARAAATLAVAAATHHGFAAAQTDYAVTVAKVTLGQVVPVVNAIAHQLHGAVGVTLEHRLWHSTMRARCWTDEFGSTTHYARRLGEIAIRAHRDGEFWDFMIGARQGAEC